jgi:class 3 adenylate cyclase
MALADDLKTEVQNIFKYQWSRRDGTVVPDPEALKLGNDAVELDGTVLYADMDGSTKLVDEQDPSFAAEVYKAYLHCAAKVVRSEGGEITAYDGDRIMAVFIGDSKNQSAVRSALKINYCVQKIVNPCLQAQYPATTYVLRQTVGIDTSKLFVARTGIRNANDLVWVGRAANYAAKLTNLSPDHPTWITDSVFKALPEQCTHGGNPKRLMWEPMDWTAMNKMRIHRSNWHWSV